MKALLALAVALLYVVPSYAQRGGSDHRDVHRDIAVLESELSKIYDKQDQLFQLALKFAGEIRAAHVDRNRAEPNQRKAADAALDRLTHESRLNSLEISRNSLEADRLRLEIERAQRIDAHLLEGGHGGARPGPKPRVRSIRNLKFDRQGPVRVNGRMGYNDTNIYEITFTDGTKQRLEEKTFTPIR